MPVSGSGRKTRGALTLPGPEIRLSEDLALPLDVVTESVGVFGKRRVGKSNTLAVFVEQLYRAGQQVVILDPKGDWWGLRSSADGNGPGLQIPIFGGYHGDLPLELDAREELARFIVEERVSCLLDLSNLRKWQLAEFLGGKSPPRPGEPDGFLETIYRLKGQEQYRTPCMVVFEEGSQIAPMKPQMNELRMLGAATDIVRRGGQRGLGSLVADQRPASLHTDIRTQFQVLVILRLIGHHDITAIDDWINVHGTKAQRAEFLQGIAHLGVGTGLVWSPGWPTEEGIFQTIQIFRRSTFDSGATPKPGETQHDPRTIADIDLNALGARLSGIIEKAKAEDPKLLQRRVRELEAQLEQAQRVQKLPNAKADAYEGAVRDNSHLVERNRSLEDELRQMRDRVGELEWHLQQARELARLLEAGRDQRLAYMRDARDAIIRIAESFNVFLFDPEAQAVLESIAPREFPAPDPSTRRRKAPAPAPPVDGPPAAKPAQDQANGKHGANDIPAPAGVKIGKGERKVMAILAQYPNGRSYNELAFLASYSSKASTLGVILANLRRAGYVNRSSNPIQLTELGMATVGHVEPLPSGPELLEHWLRHPRMGQGERTVLQALISVYERPDEPTHEELCELTASFGGPEGGYSPTASTMGVILSKLRKLGLVEKGARRVAREFYESIQEAPHKARARG